MQLERCRPDPEIASWNLLRHGASGIRWWCDGGCAVCVAGPSRLAEPDPRYPLLHPLLRAPEHQDPACRDRRRLPRPRVARRLRPRAAHTEAARACHPYHLASRQLFSSRFDHCLDQFRPLAAGEPDPQSTESARLSFAMLAPRRALG